MEEIDLQRLATNGQVGAGSPPGLNYEEAIRRMGVELGTAAARIYLLLAQVEALTAQRDSLAKALDEAQRARDAA